MKKHLGVIITAVAVIIGLGILYYSTNMNSEAKVGDTVAVHYTGKLQDGTVFDSSIERGTPIEFTLGEGRVIQGWEEGIVGMKVGEKKNLVIPPEKAYGPSGYGPIPPNATLIFDVELVSIK